MTPLAHALIRDVVLRPYQNNAANRQQIQDLMEDIHCFEVSEVCDLAEDLARQFNDDPESAIDLIKARLFLPAPKTWLEYKAVDGIFAFHLSQPAKGDVITIRMVAMFDEDATSRIVVLGHVNPESLKAIATEHEALFHEPTRAKFVFWIKRIYAYLSLINTPTIIGRRQVMPHRGLERRLVKEFGVGKFPVHAWTEIKLHVAKPTEIDDGEPHEAHLTGHRALHFCRAHIRIRLGKLEYVSAHWCGDPALGIKRSRYVAVH